MMKARSTRAQRADSYFSTAKLSLNDELAKKIDVFFVKSPFFSTKSKKKNKITPESLCIPRERYNFVVQNVKYAPTPHVSKNMKNTKFSRRTQPRRTHILYI